MSIDFEKLEKETRFGNGNFIVRKFDDESDIEAFLNRVGSWEYRFVGSHKVHGDQIIVIVEREQ